MNIRELVRQGRSLLQRKRRREPATEAADPFSLLALRLGADLSPQEKGRCILVVAADEDTAAIEAIMELAWCLAVRMGHSVLLIDGAFGDRALSVALGVHENEGLAEFLSAPPDAPIALDSLVRSTQQERIRVLPHGISAAELTIRAITMQKLVTEACQQNDFVLVLGSILIDSSRSMAFCPLVDAGLLIAVEEHTTLDQVTHGQRLLNDCGARRVALVLANRPQVRRPNGR